MIWMEIVKICVNLKMDDKKKKQLFVPWDHRLSSLGKPRDAKLQPSGRFFYPTLALMIDLQGVLGSVV